MLKNYFTIAYRNFWRNRTFSMINILGLSIGISAALVIFLIVSHEFSYDRFEPGRDRIYRVVMDAVFNGSPAHGAAVPGPLQAAVQNEMTGVGLTVPVFQFQGDASAKVSIAAGNAKKSALYKKQENIIFTNEQYFQLLGYRWVSGSPSTALREPFTVVLTEKRAHYYFPSLSPEEIIGRQITYNDDLPVTVSGIVEDLQEHTEFKGAEFISLPTIAKTHLQDDFMMNTWTDWMAYSQLYVKLTPGSHPENINGQLKKLLQKYLPADKNNPSNTISYRLQPLKDMHFNTDYSGFGQRIATPSTLYGLSAIAVFLLLLASINFINLSTAQATRRAREIGIRKTMGSSRSQLILQFLGETLFLTSLSTLVSIALAPLLLKAFAGFIPADLVIQPLRQPSLILFLVLLTGIVSLLSGLYPAFVLSRHNPVLVLKNQVTALSGQTRNAWVRKTLTVSQFVIAQFFVIATLLVGKQIHYALNADMGFRKEAILTFRQPFDTVARHEQVLLNEIKAIPGVELASNGFMSPGGEGPAITDISYQGKEDLHEAVQIRWGDSSYLDLYQLKLVAGRNVKQSDVFKEFLINETYAKMLGFSQPEEALNKMLTYNGKRLPIVGVLRDFHELSLHSPIGPMVFAGGPGHIFHIRLKPPGPDGAAWQRTIAQIHQAFSKLYPGEDFEYAFLDESIAKWYESERNTSRLLQWATGLTVLISCLGLLGLVLYTTNMRAKEIGIRKVLGASVTQLVSILSKEFVALVLLAFLIAAPLAWWASHRWLEGFAYRTPISAWIFVLSAVMIVFLALLTLSLQTIRAARVNPVKSLRAE